MSAKLIAATGVIALALTGLVGCSASNPGTVEPQTKLAHVTLDASWANAYPSVKDMTSAADAVVLGTVGQAEATTVKGGIPYTDYSFAVEQWLKGSPAIASQILIHQTGGTASGVTMEVGDDPLLVVGEKDVLYLRQYAPGKYLILGGPTGRNQVVNGQVTPMSHGIARDGLPSGIGEFSARIRNLASQPATP